LLDDLQDAGVPVAPATAQRDGAALAAWLAGQWGIQLRAGRSKQTLLAVAGAKGGIGKTLVVALWAEALHRRGLRVLVVDGDLSNSGLLPAFRVPRVFPSYLQARADGGSDWATPASLRRYVYHHERSGLNFLLGSEETGNSTADLTLRDWDALMRGIRALDEYDVVLLDTGPELKRRPYAVLAARMGGFVMFPVPPGRKERVGAGNGLATFANDDGVDLSDRCLLLFMEPEAASAVSVQQVMPRMTQLFPKAQVLGVLPRAKEVSEADEYPDAYLSPLDLAPYGRFSRAVHQLVEKTCQLTGITPPLPMPSTSRWQRWRGEQIRRQPADILARPAVLHD
jgi:MinD-like ATPase involved in chromosome partitioning or flagellar assembly